MNREYHRWYSWRLNRDMELLVFGHAGAKVLVFPTRDGRYFEYENMRMIHQLAPRIQAGYLQLFCVDSVDQETIYCQALPPQERIQRHIYFEEYVLNEVLPFMAHKNPHHCTISHGCSLGAYHAANIALRHPQYFNKLCAFSGRYDLSLSVESFRNLFDGYYSDEIYYHSPTHYLQGLYDEQQLAHLRAMDMVFVIGREDPFLDNNVTLSSILWDKGCWHAMHQWDGRAHRARYWREMINIYL